MEIQQSKGVFIVWKIFQRRVDVLAPLLGLEIFYFHYWWEEKSIIHKGLSYILKSFDTLVCCYRNKPSLIFIQLPPTPLLYCIAFYCRITGSKYITDCHNSMVFDDWNKWIFAKKLLNNGNMIVHNDHVFMFVKENMNITPFVLRTGITKKELTNNNPELLDHLGLFSKNYVILPWNILPDEPLEEVVEAAKLLPDISFVLTWYFERLSITIRNELPPNFILTGYLPVVDFNYLFANSGVAVVLTNREGTQLSGMHEAMAFGIPAVISDLKTTRYLYKDAPVYVTNNPQSIAEGIRYAINNMTELEEKIKKLRIETETEFLNQIKNLKIKLAICD